jgi:hypothetical protein
MSFHTRLEKIMSQGSLSAKDNKELIKLIKANGLPYKDLLIEAAMNLYVCGQLNDDESSICSVYREFQILDSMMEACLASRKWDLYYVGSGHQVRRVVPL